MQRIAAVMQGAAWSTLSVLEELDVNVTYWGLRLRSKRDMTTTENSWASAVRSLVTATAGERTSPSTYTSDSGDDTGCTLGATLGCPTRGILAAVESSNVPLLADILLGCCIEATEDRQHLLLEFNFSRTEAGSPPKWPHVTLKLLPTDWEVVAQKEKFLWAMIQGKRVPLKAELLLGNKANLYTQGPTVSRTHACHIVARGLEGQSSDEVRTLLFQALTHRGNNDLIGTADTYSSATTDGKLSGYPFLSSNYTFYNSIDGVGVINLENETRVWVGAVDAGGYRYFRATVVAQKGRYVKVYDGIAEVEIDLLFDRVELDMFWNYSAETKTFEKVQQDSTSSVYSKSEEPGQLSKYRTPFSPWQPPEGEQPRSLRDCGVSIGWLEDFVISNKGLETYSSFDVTDRIVKPATADKQCRYVDTLPESEVGRATYFVSHRWGAHFADMVRSIVRYHHTHGRMSVSPRQPAFVWLDLFAVNQHAKADDLKLIGEVVECAKQTLLCIDVECMVLTRLWCVYEVWQTLLKGATRPSVETPAAEPLTLQVLACGDDSEDRTEAQRRISNLWMSLSTQQAVAGGEADNKRLRNAIREVVDPVSLDLQIMSALCNTGDFTLGRKMSITTPPWATAEPGATLSIDQCKRRVQSLYRQLPGRDTKWHQL